MLKDAEDPADSAARSLRSLVLQWVSNLMAPCPAHSLSNKIMNVAVKEVVNPAATRQTAAAAAVTPLRLTATAI